MPSPINSSRFYPLKTIGLGPKKGSTRHLILPPGINVQVPFCCESFRDSQLFSGRMMWRPLEASAELFASLILSSYSHEFAMQKKEQGYAKHHLGAGFILSLLSHAKVIIKNQFSCPSHHPQVTYTVMASQPTPQKNKYPRRNQAWFINGWLPLKHGIQPNQSLTLVFPPLDLFR